MQEHPTITSPFGSRLAWLAVGLAYALTLVGVALPLGPGVALSSLAIVALGAAVAWRVNAAVGSQPRPRLGARAEAAWRRERALALSAAAGVFAVLVLGVLTTNAGALWDCDVLPLCPAGGDAALLATAHRVLAAGVTLLVATLALFTLRARSERSLRLAAGAAIGLMTAQNAVGLAQVLLARSGDGLPVAVSRLAHLGIGALAWAAVVALATLAVRLPPTVSAAAARPARLKPEVSSLIKDYVSLTKPGVITLLIFTTLAGMLITPEGLPSLGLVFWTMLGGWLMPSGAHALNCYFDRDIDVKMGRTGRRPLPSNRIPAWHALVLGVTLGALAFAILAVFVNMAAALLALAGYVYYVFIYTLWLKRSSFNNIVIGGGAGAFPPLVGWAAVTGGLTLPALFLFAIIFYWTPPHFWALALIRQKDYANAGVPMLPVVAGDAETRRQILLYTILMIVLSILLVPLQLVGFAYLALAVALGALFLRYVLRLLRDGAAASAWALYRFSLLYLFLLFLAMILDRLAFA